MAVDSDTQFCLAVLRGAVEHQDGSMFFGSLGAYRHWLNAAVKRGWVVESTRLHKTEKDLVVGCQVATDLGRQVYESSGVGQFSQGRFSGWDWSKVVGF